MDPGCVASILATASLNIAFTSLAEHRHFLSALFELKARHSDQYEGHVCLYTANLISHKIIAMGFKNHMIMMTSPGAA